MTPDPPNPTADPQLQVVLDPDAWIRTPPPELRVMGPSIPQYTRVRVLEASGAFARVRGEDGADYGWTALQNLGSYFKDDPQLLAAPLAGSLAIALLPGASALRRALADVYGRLGGLMTALGARLQVAVPGALAVWYVESGGGAQEPGRATIRFENHLLYRLWGAGHPGDYDEHFQHGGRAGVAGQPWENHRFRISTADAFRSFHGSQDAEYQVLSVAMQLAGEDTALRCISIGGPQILVSAYRILGYASPREMYDAFQQGERAQVLGFFDFCQYRFGAGPLRGELIRHLAAQEFDEFARAYNGAGQVARYASLIRAAFVDATAMLAAASAVALAGGAAEELARS